MPTLILGLPPAAETSNKFWGFVDAPIPTLPPFLTVTLAVPLPIAPAYIVKSPVAMWGAKDGAWKSPAKFPLIRK